MREDVRRALGVVLFAVTGGAVAGFIAAAGATYVGVLVIAAALATITAVLYIAVVLVKGGEFRPTHKRLVRLGGLATTAGLPTEWLGLWVGSSDKAPLQALGLVLVLVGLLGLVIGPVLLTLGVVRKPLEPVGDLGRR